jgi:hypothetical protein
MSNSSSPITSAYLLTAGHRDTLPAEGLDLFLGRNGVPGYAPALGYPVLNVTSAPWAVPLEFVAENL